MRVTMLPAEREEEISRRVKRKRAVKIVAVLLVLVVAFTLFFAIVLNVNSLGVGRGNTDGAYGRVLADIEGITDADPRIIDIAMLGAHDANTASLEPGNPIDDNPKSDVFEQLYPVSAGFQYRMSVTQTVSPHELLMQGVRFVHSNILITTTIGTPLTPSSAGSSKRMSRMCCASLRITGAKWWCSFCSPLGSETIRASTPSTIGWRE